MVSGFHTLEDNVVLGQPVPVFLLGALRICRRSSFRLRDQESGQPVPFYSKALALHSACTYACGVLHTNPNLGQQPLCITG